MTVNENLSGAEDLVQQVTKIVRDRLPVCKTLYCARVPVIQSIEGDNYCYRCKPEQIGIQKDYVTGDYASLIVSISEEISETILPQAVTRSLEILGVNQPVEQTHTGPMPVGNTATALSTENF